MDLHYLEIFYEVAKARSFTKAAEKLYINQSAVSIQIKKFEEILGSKLFDRSSKKIKLTYAGEALFKMAVEIFEKVKRTEKEIFKIIDMDKAKIYIGASPIIAEPLLPRMMKEFVLLHDEIEYEIIVSSKENLLTLLREGDIDVIIIDSEHIMDSNLEIITMEKVPYVLVGSKAYSSVKDVAKDPLITRSAIPNNRRAIEIVEDKFLFSFTTKISVVGNLEVIKGMVKEGIGNVILPYYAVQKEIEDGQFKIIHKILEVKDGYEVIVTRDKKDAAYIRKFVDFVKNYRMMFE